MPRNPLHVVGAILVGFALCGVAQARELSFEERVVAQESIERVYHAQRSGETRAFEEAVTRDVLERKVRNYLDRSVLLDRFWNRPVTAEALARELARMQRDSKMPGRLHGLFDALDNDAFLIQECLARRALVRRLTQNFFASDERIHGAPRREADVPRYEKTTWEAWWADTGHRYASGTTASWACSRSGRLPRSGPATR